MCNFIRFYLRSILLFFSFFSGSVFAVDYYWGASGAPSTYPTPIEACTAAQPAYAGTSTPVTITYVSDIKFGCNVTDSGSGSLLESFYFATRGGDGCPSGTAFNSVNGTCESTYVCSSGELSNGCAVQCPIVVYTYFKDGVSRRGQLGAGQVGYGQTCPQPSFPPGSDSACVGAISSGDCGTPGDPACPCSDFASATNENETVTETSETETTDGDTVTTNTETTIKDGITQTDPNPGSGKPATTTSGTAVDPNTEGLSAETENIGNQTFAKCDHGGLVDGVIGCDYNPPSCAAGQVAASFGCVDKPQYDPPPDPGKTEIVKTTDPVTGETTTTKTETTGTSTEKAKAESNRQAKKQETFGGGQSCSAPPVCSGSPIQCGIAKQEWLQRCAGGPKANDLYQEAGEGEDLTFNKVLTDFQTELNATELVSSMNDFFTISTEGSCPVWSVSVWEFDITIDQQCSDQIPWGIISGLIIAVASLLAMRIAFT